LVDSVGSTITKIHRLAIFPEPLILRSRTQNQGFSIFLLRDLRLNKIPIFEREGWQSQPSLSKMGIFLLRNLLRITYEIKPGIFDEKRGIAALLIKNSGFYFIFDP